LPQIFLTTPIPQQSHKYESIAIKSLEIVRVKEEGKITHLTDLCSLGV